MCCQLKWLVQSIRQLEYDHATRQTLGTGEEEYSIMLLESGKATTGFPVVSHSSRSLMSRYWKQKRCDISRNVSMETNISEK